MKPLDPTPHPDAFAAHTLSLSCHGDTRATVWWRGFYAGLSVCLATAVLGVLGSLFMLMRL